MPIRTGELDGSATAVQMPSISCRYAQVTAVSTNTGQVYIGGPGVTASTGSTNTTAGTELEPGEPTGWIPVNNFNELYFICTVAADRLVYMVATAGY